MSATQTELFNYLKLPAWWSHAAEKSTLGVFVMLVVLFIQSVLSVSLTCRNEKSQFLQQFLFSSHISFVLLEENNITNSLDLQSLNMNSNIFS